MIREYKETPREMGVVGLRSLTDGSLVVVPSTDVQGFINKFDFAKKTNTHETLTLEFRKMVESEGFDNVVLEVVELIDAKPEATRKERLDELTVLYDVIQDKIKQGNAAG